MKGDEWEISLTDKNNKWTEKYSENDKSYLIVIDSMEVAEKFSYGIITFYKAQETLIKN